MSIRLMTAIWNQAESLNLTGTDTAILIKMADFAADDGSSVYPSVAHLSKRTRFSESSIKRSIKSLLDRKILLKIEEYAAHYHATNLYKINAVLFYGEKRRGGVHSDLPSVHSDLPSVHSDLPSVHSDLQSINKSLYKPLNNIVPSFCQSGDDVADAPHLWLKEFYDEEDSLELKEKPVKAKRSKAESKQLEEQFNQWYVLYPRKEARKKAQISFRFAIKAVAFDKLLECTKLYAHSVEDKDKQFLPFPATWLNQERWNDVQSPFTVSAASAQPEERTDSPEIQSTDPETRRILTNISRRLPPPVFKSWFIDNEFEWIKMDTFTGQHKQPVQVPIFNVRNSFAKNNIELKFKDIITESYNAS